MKIYVLTAGEYSDYHIETVKISKDDAKRLSEIHDWEIEEFDTDEITIPERTVYTITLNKKSGRIRVEEGEEYGMNEIKKNTVVFIPPTTRIEMMFGETGEFKVKVEAKDRKSAEKIASDLIAKARYNKEVEEMEGEE